MAFVPLFWLFSPVFLPTRRRLPLRSPNHYRFRFLLLSSCSIRCLGGVGFFRLRYFVERRLHAAVMRRRVVARFPLVVLVRIPIFQRIVFASPPLPLDMSSLSRDGGGNLSLSFCSSFFYSSSRGILRATF